jgi:hypothetical protein
VVVVVVVLLVAAPLAVAALILVLESTRLRICLLLLPLWRLLADAAMAVLCAVVTIWRGAAPTFHAISTHAMVAWLLASTTATASDMPTTERRVLAVTAVPTRLMSRCCRRLCRILMVTQSHLRCMRPTPLRRVSMSFFLSLTLVPLSGL